MSYCRWSSDGFMCDLYAYESVDNFFYVHVAANRVTERCPEIDFTSEETIKNTLPAYNEWLRKDKERKPIGLPYDGKTFVCENINEVYECMVTLKDCGYNVPDFALENVKEEMALH